MRRAGASRSSGGAVAALGPTTVSLQDATAEGVAQSCVVQGRPLLLSEALGSESDAVSSRVRQPAADAQAAEAVCPEGLAACLRAALPPFAAWRRHGDLLEHLEEPAEAEAVACLAVAAGSTAAGEDVYGALCFNYLARGAPGSGDADAATDGGQAVEWIVVPNEHKAAAAPHCNPHCTATPASSQAVTPCMPGRGPMHPGCHPTHPGRRGALLLGQRSSSVGRVPRSGGGGRAKLPRAAGARRAAYPPSGQPARAPRLLLLLLRRHRR